MEGIKIIIKSIKQFEDETEEMKKFITAFSAIKDEKFKQFIILIVMQKLKEETV